MFSLECYQGKEYSRDKTELSELNKFFIVGCSAPPILTPVSSRIYQGEDIPSQSTKLSKLCATSSSQLSRENPTSTPT